MSTKNTGTISAILTGQGLTVVFPSGVRMIHSSDAAYQSALEAYRANDSVKLEEIMNPRVAIAKFAEGNLSFDENGAVTLAGKPISNYAITKIKELQAKDLPWRPLARFLEKLMANPSSRAVTELYKFLETENLPLTEDGDFLAYKRVRDDWKDFHTGNILNHIGTFVEEPRNEVDDDPSRGCSRGLHAGALSYVNGFNSGGHLIIVKINPTDVVSIPHEDVRKLRCCKYFVVQEMQDTLTKSPLYRNDSAAPILTRAELETLLTELEAEIERSENEDESLDDEQDQLDEVVHALREVLTDIVGMPVATDVPLSRVLSAKERRLFKTFLDDEFGYEFSEDESLEEIAEAL